MPELLERLRKLEAAAAADVMVAMGLTNQVLSPDLNPLGSAQIVGRALCAEGRVGAEPTAIATFELDQAVTAGDVVIIASYGYRKGALIGENMVTSMVQRGATGFILDSGVRDASALAAGPVPVYCAYRSPANGHRFWAYTSIGGSVTLPGIWDPVLIHSGDYILGDSDGVCVLPTTFAEQIVANAEIHMRTEARIKVAIESGVARDQATRDSQRLKHVVPVTTGAVAIDE